ncbi:hypothetical protein ACFL35_17450 [Candidatus Riflebacteria bacterium]
MNKTLLIFFVLFIFFINFIHASSYITPYLDDLILSAHVIGFGKVKKIRWINKRKICLIEIKRFFKNFKTGKLIPCILDLETPRDIFLKGRVKFNTYVLIFLWELDRTNPASVLYFKRKNLNKNFWNEYKEIFKNKSLFRPTNNHLGVFFGSKFQEKYYISDFSYDKNGAPTFAKSKIELELVAKMIEGVIKSAKYKKAQKELENEILKRSSETR